MELFFENKKMWVNALEIYDEERIAIIENGERTFHTSETGWDIDTGFELHVRRKTDAHIHRDS